MPEQLTKHPEVTLQVLRSAGAKCGEGVSQEILSTCPKEYFCKLPGGELCIFGLRDASKMTHITPAEWKALVGSGVVEAGQELPPPSSVGWLSGVAGVLLGVLISLAIAHVLRRGH